MNKKVIIKILIISLMLLLAFCTNVYCVKDTSTVRMKIVDEGQAWTNINISESYAECESLNSTSSTLGTAALEAHLTTDYDWSIMAIFSVSQYGATTTNAPSATSTTKNKSGIYDIGKNNVQTTTLVNGSTSTSTEYLYGLYNIDGTHKKYINKIDSATGKEYDESGNETGRIAISYSKENGTYSWFDSTKLIGTDIGSPVGIKIGIFGVRLGNGSGYSSYMGHDGEPSSKTTFRPVIWN